MLAAVDVGAEQDAVLVDVALLSQREDLEAATVRQDRPVPVHELVKPPRLLHQLVAGSEVQVVGVGQEDGRPCLLHVPGRHGLHRGLGTHGHVYGGVDVPVGGVEATQPGPGLLVHMQHFKLEILAHILSFIQTNRRPQS